MNRENLSILETSSDDKPYNLPVHHTCGECGFTSLQGFENCPQCIETQEVETPNEISGEGKWLIILGSIYGVISLVIVLNSGGNIIFFSKASDKNFLSVSHFVALFGFSLILIPTGIITLIRKKDNWKSRMIIFGIIAVVVFTFDQILMRIF